MIRDQYMTNGEYQRILYRLHQTLWRFGLPAGPVDGGEKEYIRYIRRYIK